MLGFYLCYYSNGMGWGGMIDCPIIDGYCFYGEIDDGWLQNSYEDSLN